MDAANIQPETWFSRRSVCRIDHGRVGGGGAIADGAFVLIELDHAIQV